MNDSATVSMLDPACAACPYVKTCNHKRMAMAQALIGTNCAKGTMDCASDLSLPMARKTITIVIDGVTTQVYEDELRKAIEKALYQNTLYRDFIIGG